MKAEPVAGIQPTVMRWARQTIGLTVPEVARALKQPIAVVEAWELGASAPSYVQLEKLAYQLYKRPMAVFFLPAPPEEVTPDREFRTLPEADLKSLWTDTYVHIRRAHAYQVALRELFDGGNPSERCIWRSLSLSLSRSVVEQAAEIRAFLGITLVAQVAWKDDEIALKSWRKSVEDVGVFVFKAAFKQKDISGFCLIDKVFPLAYLNNSTTKTRQIFSLLHELVHILLSVNGLSKFDQQYIDKLPSEEKRIERFCNAVAAEVLIPGADFLEQAKRLPSDIEMTTEEGFSALAARYGVSREAVLRRLLDQGRVSQSFYEAKAKLWSGQKRSGGGGSWYASQNAYLSARFAREVVSRHYNNQISVDKAADFLGVNAKNFDGLEQRILQGASM